MLSAALMGHQLGMVLRAVHGDGCQTITWPKLLYSQQVLIIQNKCTLNPMAKLTWMGAKPRNLYPSGRSQFHGPIRSIKMWTPPCVLEHPALSWGSPLSVMQNSNYFPILRWLKIGRVLWNCGPPSITRFFILTYNMDTRRIYKRCKFKNL